MKHVFLFGLVLTSLSSFHASAEGKQEQSCELRISFGSYSSGTPRDVIKKVDKILEELKDDIKKTTRRNWGKEGEFDYCLDFKSKSVLNSAHKKVLDVVPAKSKHGYTRVFLNGEQTKATTWGN